MPPWFLTDQISFNYFCRGSPSDDFCQSKEEGKYQESINQVPNVTKDTTWESDQNTRKHHIQESQEVSPFQAYDHKIAMNRQDSMTDTKHKEQKRFTKEAPP